MAKKLKLHIDYFDEYHLLSIASHLKDYRLTYYINEVLDIDLKKYDDLKVTGAPGNYSWYFYNGGENLPYYFLVSNNHPDGKLVSTQKGIDYYLFIKEIFDDKHVDEIASHLRKINGVLGVFPTDMTTIKKMDSVIEALELHELEKIKKLSSTKPNLS